MEKGYSARFYSKEYIVQSLKFPYIMYYTTLMTQHKTRFSLVTLYVDSKTLYLESLFSYLWLMRNVELKFIVYLDILLHSIVVFFLTTVIINIYITKTIFCNIYFPQY